jgi:hypothetical protein
VVSKAWASFSDILGVVQAFVFAVYFVGSIFIFLKHLEHYTLKAEGNLYTRILGLDGNVRGQLGPASFSHREIAAGTQEPQTFLGIVVHEKYH